MLLNITSIIDIINSVWWLSMLSGLLLFCVICLLSILIHEFGHWIVTMYFCKPVGYTCKVKILSNSSKPHTESEYYKFLQDNKSNHAICSIIRYISIAGYIASFTYLLLSFCILVFVFFVFEQHPFGYASLFTIMYILVDVWKYFNSSDRCSFNEPTNFEYKY